MIKLPRAFSPGFIALAAAAITGFVIPQAHSQTAGSLDRSYTPAAVAVKNGDEKAASSVRAIALQADGKAILAGRSAGEEGSGRALLVRLHADGSRDRTFTAAGLNDGVNAVAVTAKGQIMAGGSFTGVSDGARGMISRARIARFNADGSLDKDFRPGSGANGAIRAMAVQADGRTVIGGAFSDYNGTARDRVARLEADGSLDASFAAEVAADGAVDAVAVQEADGKVLVSGSFALYGGSIHSRLVRLRANGALDPAFRHAADIDGRVRAVTLQKDGRILIGGDFSAVEGESRHGIARLNADGSLDRSFQVGAGADGGVYAVAVHGADSRVLIAGAFHSVDGLSRGGIAGLNANGNVDRSFTVGVGANALVRAAAFQHGSGRVLVGGDFTLIDGVVRGAVARLHTAEIAAAAPRAAVLSGVDRGAKTRATEAPMIAFGATSFVASENTGMATISVVRTGDTTAQATVDYATSDGTAINGADYTATSGTLTFPAGDGSPQFFTIPVAVDGMAEPDETVNITLTAPAGATFANNAATLVTTLTITDEQPTFLQLSDVTYTASETAGQAIITVQRSGGSNRAVSVFYMTADDPNATNAATADTDYTPVIGQVSWAAGDYTPKTFAIPLVIDSESEFDETFVVSIMNANGPAQVGPRVQATVTIADSATSIIQFSGPNFTAVQSTGQGVVVVTRTGGDGSPVSVDYQTFDSDAVSTGNNQPDFTATSGTLNWAKGDFTSKSITIPVSSQSNGVQPDKSFVVALGNPQPQTDPNFIPPGGAVLGPQDQTTVTITQNPPSTINFSSATYLASELQGTVRITATRTGTGFGGASVDYFTSNGTAIAGNDYTTVSGTLTWAAGDFTPKSFLVPVTNDGVAEQNENVVLTLTNPGGLAILGSINQANLIITDQAPASLQFVTANSSVNESAKSATITVTRTGSGTGAVSVDYSTASGTAVAAQDFTSTSGTITFADGNFTPQTITIPILQDTVNEPNETFTVNLSNPVGEAVIGTPAQTTLTIVNTPTTSLQFSSTNYTTSENAPGGALITVTRTGDLSSAVSVDYTTSDGTATAGSDYTTTSGTINFGVGESTAKTFTVPILPDSITEPAETVNLSLTRPVGPVLLGGGGTATLTITDNAAASLQFTQTTYAGNEMAPVGSITVAVSRVGNTVGAVSVDYSLQSGTAIGGGSLAEGADFLNSTGTLTWADGDASPKTFVVTIFNDAIPEPTETFTAMLSNPQGSAVIGTVNTATLSINDDDAAPIVQFSAPSFTASENSTNAVITVTRTGSNVGAVSVDYVSIAGGSATPGSPSAGGGVMPADADYLSVVGTVNFAAGDLSPKSFLVPIINDSAREGSETVLFNLSNPTGNARIGTQAQTTLTIVDDDMPSSVQFTAASYNAPAGSTTAVITVSRLGGSGSAISVAYSTADGTAVAGVDYAATSGTLNFAAGDTTPKSFVVPILRSAADSPKAFSVVLSDPTGGTSLGTTSQSTVTIAGTVLPVVTVIAKGSAVTEGQGRGTFVVSRDGGNLNSELVVNFQLKGRATKGVDFVGVGKRVRIPAGAVSAKIKIAPLNDGATEGDERVKIVLLPGDTYTLGSPAVSVLTIHDAN